MVEVNPVAAGSLSVALLALWRSFRRDGSKDTDDRTREIIRLTVGEQLAVLQSDVTAIKDKLGIG
jgi:hypothetical protein